MEPDASWFSRIVDWFDRHGMLAWIMLMVVGFVVFWPVGLVVLGFLIGSKRMCSGKLAGMKKPFRRGFRSSGNSAFDNYRDETLKRLEREQREFSDFLQRLRDAKDKAEFDRFFEERLQNS